MQIDIQSSDCFIAGQKILALLTQHNIQPQKIEIQRTHLRLELMPQDLLIIEQLKQIPEIEHIHQLDCELKLSHIVARSPKMQDVVQKISTFARLDAPLLIQGETGTGKDLLAKLCHQLSHRHFKKFIAVNCAGLPSEDAESEMFGRHDKENESIGFFEYADGSTVLLDGIAELPLALQAKLLRFLTDGTFRRVGEEKENYANVRVICTSQVPLQHYVEQGRVRSDLFHRLNVLTLAIPPLRERKEDIAELTQLFLQQIAQQLNIKSFKFSPHFIQYLENYPNWSGNIRELYNALYRACCLTKDGQLSIENLHLTQNEEMTADITQFSEEQTLENILGQFEATILRQFYEHYPSTRKLAVRLGVSHTAIANKLRLYNIR